MKRRTGWALRRGHVVMAGVYVAVVVYAYQAIVWYQDFFTGYFLLYALLAVIVVPVIVRLLTGVVLPFSALALSASLVVASTILGEFYDFYERFLWWDTFLHGATGVMFAYYGYLLLMTKELRMKVRFSGGFMAWWSMMFSLGIALLWEVFEYAIDKAGRGPMQYGLDDTMVDMIAASIGAVVFMLLVAVQYTAPRFSVIHGATAHFRKLNAKLKP